MGATDGPGMTVAEAEAFLYHEVRLLDDRRLAEWNDLFTEDGVYALPFTVDADPELDSMLLYDTALQRKMRVHQLLRYEHLAQSPPSRTVHVVNNVEVDNAGDDGVVVHCNIVVYEVRPLDFQELQAGMASPRFIVGQCIYRLQPFEQTWKIAKKQVLLIDRELPLYNLSFLV
jgi:benzoate/toluate 1,2-dioxygenase subunit beta